MTVGIVGLGLIGGSIGLALREPGRKIVGYDPNPESVKTARSRFCIDSEASLEEVAQADIVFVAAPPAAVISVLDTIWSSKAPQTVVSDCTSVKANVIAWATKQNDPNFVAGHPMAGHENSGAAFASAWMFRNARWILCPVKGTSKTSITTVESAIKAMGATPVRMKPEDHDRQVATVSHLPHAIAGALVLLRSELGDGDFSGGSWRDLTRVGGVDPNLWTQIFMENRVELSKAIHTLEVQLEGLKASLDNENAAGVHHFLERVKQAKKTDGH